MGIFLEIPRRSIEIGVLTLPIRLPYHHVRNTLISLLLIILLNVQFMDNSFRVPLKHIDFHVLHLRLTVTLHSLCIFGKILRQHKLM